MSLVVLWDFGSQRIPNPIGLVRVHHKFMLNVDLLKQKWSEFLYLPISPTQTMHYYWEIPQIYHTFATIIFRFQPLNFGGVTQMTKRHHKICAIYYKSLTWMFRPFWGSDSLTITTFWGNSNQPEEIGRYKLPRTRSQQPYFWNNGTSFITCRGFWEIL